MEDKKELKENQFSDTVESLFKGMDTFITSKTIVGDAIEVSDGTTILPLVEVSFGVAAGAFVNPNEKKNNGGGGMGGKIQPSAVIVVKDGNPSLVNLKNTDSVSKIIDMVPGILDRFKPKDQDKKKKKDNDETAENRSAYEDE